MMKLSSSLILDVRARLLRSRREKEVRERGEGSREYAIVVSWSFSIILYNVLGHKRERRWKREE